MLGNEPSAKISRKLATRLRRMERHETVSLIVVTRRNGKRDDLYAMQDYKVPTDQKIEAAKRVLNQSTHRAKEVAQKNLDADNPWWGEKGPPVPPDYEDLFDYTDLWLINGFIINATRNSVQALVEQPEVAGLIENKVINISRPMFPMSDEVVEETDDVTWGLNMIKAKEVWSQGFLGDGVLIGHLDTGVDSNHQDLNGKVAEWAAFDQFGNKLHGVPIFDSDMHGTHTAGTLVGGNASGIRIGVAPNAKLVSAQVIPYGYGETRQILLGAEWAISKGAKVLCMSLGGIGYDSDFEQIFGPEMLDFGVLPVCAIGNEGLGVTGSPGNMRVSCAVGAVDKEGGVAHFSGGGSFDHFVNGNQSRYIKPDLSAPGVSIFSSIPLGYERGNYLPMNGTSMAAPHVAGILALLCQAAPDVPPRELLEAVYSSCNNPNAQEAHDNRYGRGIIQSDVALNKVLTLQGRYV